MPSHTTQTLRTRGRERNEFSPKTRFQKKNIHWNIHKYAANVIETLIFVFEFSINKQWIYIGHWNGLGEECRCNSTILSSTIFIGLTALSLSSSIQLFHIKMICITMHKFENGKICMHLAINIEECAWPHIVLRLIYSFQWNL